MVLNDVRLLSCTKRTKHKSDDWSRILKSCPFLRLQCLCTGIINDYKWSKWQELWCEKYIHFLMHYVLSNKLYILLFIPPSLTKPRDQEWGEGGELQKSWQNALVLKTLFNIAMWRLVLLIYYFTLISVLYQEQMDILTVRNTKVSKFMLSLDWISPCNKR